MMKYSFLFSVASFESTSCPASKDSFYAIGVQSVMSEGRSYGLPDSVGPIVFWYNRELCEKAGVDPSEMKHWEDLLEAAKKCKAAGIIPMAVGGSEKWPIQFYPALLMMRILGKDGMAWCDLPNNQKIVQYPNRGELLLNGRLGSRKVLNPGSHMKRSHGS